MKRAIFSLILTLSIVLTLAACTTAPSTLPVETQSSQAPLGEQTQTLAEPFVMSDRFSGFPYEYLADKFVPVTPLTIDERYDRDGQLLWLYFRSFPQFMNMDTFSDGLAIGAINKYYQTECEHWIEATALEKQSQIDAFEKLFAANAENSSKKWLSAYTSVQYKTAVAGTYTSDYGMYNILNVFSLTDTYGGGAHLYEKTSCAVFSLKTGAKIALDDLFTVGEESYVKRLSDEMYTALKNENHLYTTNANRKEEALKMLKPYITDDTFSLSENGLIIMVEPVGAQNVPATIFSITIPYERIKDIMIPPEDIADIPA
jgi:hypothetical protein